MFTGFGLRPVPLWSDWLGKTPRTTHSGLEIVDLEVHVIAPRELDFVALEHVLTEAQADALARGYSGISALPELSSVRPLYRMLCYLLEIQDFESISDWLRRPALFGRG